MTENKRVSAPGEFSPWSGEAPLTLEEFKKTIVRMGEEYPDEEPVLKIKWTSEIATWILENRNPKGGYQKSKQKSLHTLKEGRRDVHNGIALRKDGTLAGNGQLRLCALAKAGIPTTISTKFNCR
jgi:hypothetical protein